MTRGDDTASNASRDPGVHSDAYRLESLKEQLAPEFEVVRRLGGGLHSTVYLAREPTLRRLVAVKVLHPTAARHQKRLARFRREARALASVSHPNVVSIFQVGTLTSDAPYLVMQYVRGRDLAERLAAEGPIEEAGACGILAAVAAALAAVHSHGIVHRDVRPQSILSEFGTDRTLLSDFGLARYLAGAEAEAETLTTAGHVITDYRFTSPEVLGGTEPTVASDVYSLGILGYHVLTGLGPYPATTPQAQVRAHLLMDPLSMKALGVEVRADLESLLGSCLSKDPGSRPQIGEVARALGTLSEGTASGPASDEEASPRGIVLDGVPKAGEDGMPAYTMTLLGGLDLRSADGSVNAVLTQPKRVALLAYLAAGMVTGFRRRDTLIGVFWPDADPESGRHSLRQALYVLRSALGPDVVVTRGDGEVGLQREAFYCDAASFETLAQAGRAAEALDLYCGDLLAGFYLDNVPDFERWLDVERLRLRMMAARLAWIVSGEASARAEKAQAAHWARVAAELDPFDESALHRLIELLDSQGDRAGALAAYDHFAQRLEEEYAAAPSSETRLLVERVRKQR